MNYHYPKLSKIDSFFIRSPGPGLGNLLFPIAAALSNAKDSGEVFVFPTIPQLKIGPILRREADSRLYFHLFRRRNFSELMTWMCANLVHIRKACKINSKYMKDHTFVYEGMENYFTSFNHNKDYIKDWLIQNAYSQQNNYQQVNGRICIHIRQGDYLDDNYSCDTFNESPLSWYVDKLQEHYNASSEVVIFTDGAVEPISSAFDGFNFRFDNSKNALDAILNLSTGEVLIASNSTFSLWGAFLSYQCKLVFRENFDYKYYLGVQKY